jgi:Predicted nucleoside-diphosphate sugar epimerases
MKKTVAIIGSSGAIGSAFCKSLLEDHSIEKIYKFARNNIDKDSDNEISISIDIEDEASIKKAIDELPEDIRFDLIFVATRNIAQQMVIFSLKKASKI